MFKKAFVIVSPLIVFLTFGFGVTYGHGTGQTIEKESNGYFIDIDYDSAELKSGESVRFNFNLWNNKDRSSAPDFTDVWVRIAPVGQPGIIYAGDMHRSSFGSTGFTYLFPKPGEHELTVRFQNLDKTLTDDIVFPLTVLEGSSDKQSNQILNPLIAGIIGLFIGVLVMLVIRPVLTKIDKI